MGGAIFNATGASLTVIDSTVNDNPAVGGETNLGTPSTPGMGGAIAEAGGVARIQNSRIAHNRAVGGLMLLDPTSGERNGPSLG